MDALDTKLNDYFTGYVVRKDLVKQVASNAAVPNYVLEFLLGQNCATDNEELIEAGIARVKDILAEHYVERAEAGAIQSDIKQHGYKRIIDKITVVLNEKKDRYEASFENLRISGVLVDSATVKDNRRLLVSGVWCIADLSYYPTDARDESPFTLGSLKPIQMAYFSLDGYRLGRQAFTTDEWIDAIIRSTGLDPAKIGRRGKLLMLTRLVPYCERNYNLVELGPKGTGKSHVFSELSPHGILISGGEVTPAKLFVNNSTGRIGLVGYWDSVAFDEFAGKNKRPKADIVDILKNYMANKTFSRGIDQITAEASLAFVGNTSHDVGHMIRKTDLFADLPDIYHDPAYIDRIHAYIPGWEMDIIRTEMFSADFGFIVDYLAEALKALRSLDFSGCWREHFELHPSLSTRDQDGVKKTFAGLMKIIHPTGEATAQEMAELLEAALELRKRVKDSLFRIDETFDHVDFAYREKGGGEWKRVQTLEEVEYANVYHLRDLNPPEDDAGAVGSAGAAAGGAVAGEGVAGSAGFGVAASGPVAPGPVAPGPVAGFASAPVAPAPAEAEAGPVPEDDAVALFEGHVAFRENQRGISYENLFGPHLDGARRIEIVDPYVRAFHQCRNLMELIETAMRHFDFSEASPQVHLVTSTTPGEAAKQEEFLERIRESVEPQDIDFTWEYRDGLHARHLYIDDRWDILLDRGLDIWQYYDLGDLLAMENRFPEARRVRAFELTFLRR